MPKAARTPVRTNPHVAGLPGSRRRVGRPPLSPDEIEARVAAYCARYGVAASDGMPPFPAGQRETPQHREWLGLYKARQRHSRRSAEATVGGSRPETACGICGKPLGSLDEGDASGLGARGPGAPRRLALHPACAALARAAETAGPDAVAGLGRFLRRDRPR